MSRGVRMREYLHQWAIDDWRGGAFSFLTTLTFLGTVPAAASHAAGTFSFATPQGAMRVFALVFHQVVIVEMLEHEVRKLASESPQVGTVH
jgi:hypothetical protein